MYNYLKMFIRNGVNKSKHILNTLKNNNHWDRILLGKKTYKKCIYIAAETSKQNFAASTLP